MRNRYYELTPKQRVSIQNKHAGTLDVKIEHAAIKPRDTDINKAMLAPKSKKK